MSRRDPPGCSPPEGGNLRAAVLSATSAAPQRWAVRYLVEKSHRFAQAYLYTKRRRGRLHLAELSVDDLALDCIAELFARDDDGAFPVLRSYFGDNTEGEEVHVALRRLVFSKVNESLFRRYRESDPNLAKIIRNVKDAVAVIDDLVLERRGGLAWVRLARPDASGRSETQLPTAPPELLEAYLAANIEGRSQVRDLVRVSVDFLTDRSHYDHGYPLTALARAIRAAFTCVGVVDDEDEPDGSTFHPFEVAKAIVVATARVGVDKEAQYVGRGKVEAATYVAYVQSVRAYLGGQYLEGAEVVSNYEALTRQLPGLDEGTYRREHRNVVEYLGKLARTQLVEQLRETV